MINFIQGSYSFKDLFKDKKSFRIIIPFNANSYKNIDNIFNIFYNEFLIHKQFDNISLNIIRRNFSKSINKWKVAFNNLKQSKSLLIYLYDTEYIQGLYSIHDSFKPLSYFINNKTNLTPTYIYIGSSHYYITHLIL